MHIELNLKAQYLEEQWEEEYSLSGIGCESVKQRQRIYFAADPFKRAECIARYRAVKQANRNDKRDTATLIR